MAKLNLFYYDHPVLRETAQPIESITDRHRELARDMAETMYHHNGIGLAANQVGVTERIVVVDVDWPDQPKRQKRTPLVLINPEIIDESIEDEIYSEGCLSLPEINGDVWRAIRIRCRYQSLDGQIQEIEAEGLKARCILHEVDHLNGTLFIDRMDPDERQKIAGKLNQLRKTYHSA